MLRLSSLPIVLALAACAGDAGPTGPQGPAGPTGPEGPTGPAGPASISAVTPLAVYVDHDATITVSGSGTSWTSAATVDFGPDIDVVSTVVASPSAIIAEVTTQRTAEVGTRSISVTDGSQTLTFDDAFTVESSLTLEAMVGTLTPGATVRATVRQADPATPFESPVTISFAESGLEGTVLAETSSTVSATWDVPFTASPGDRTIEVMAPGAGGSITSSLLPAMTLPAPSPTDVPVGVATALAIDDEEGSIVVRVTPPAGAFVTLNIDNTAPSTFAPFPTNLIAPDSVFDLIQDGAFLATTGEPWHLAIQAPPEGPYTFDVTFDTMTVAAVAVDATPVAGDFTTFGQKDLYSFSATAGDVISVFFDQGATDPCSAIDAEFTVIRPSGRAVSGGRALGCTGAPGGIADETGTYFLSIRSTLENPFDYEVSVVTN